MRDSASDCVRVSGPNSPNRPHMTETSFYSHKFKHTAVIAAKATRGESFRRMISGQGRRFTTGNLAWVNVSVLRPRKALSLPSVDDFILN